MVRWSTVMTRLILSGFSLLGEQPGLVQTVMGAMALIPQGFLVDAGAVEGRPLYQLSHRGSRTRCPCSPGV